MHVVSRQQVPRPLAKVKSVVVRVDHPPEPDACLARFNDLGRQVRHRHNAGRLFACSTGHRASLPARRRSLAPVLYRWRFSHHGRKANGTSSHAVLVS